MQNETRMFFKTSGGVTILSTPSEFEKNWKSYILGRGETYTAVPEIDPELALATFDQILEDRDGKWFSVWHTYYQGKVVSVKWTIGGLASLTETKDFMVEA